MLSLGGLLFAFLRKDNQQNTILQKRELPKQAEITNLPRDQKPSFFPEGVPIESGAEIVQNFDAINTRNEKQGTRDFFSKKTIEENFVFYKNYFTTDGWTIISEQEKTEVGWLIFAEKGNNAMNIRIYEDIATKKVRVSLNNIAK